MKIFLSWSGPRSRKIAEGLDKWLPQIIQSVDIFFSPNNRKSVWIHYEAGAMVKTIGSPAEGGKVKGRVCTLLSGLTPADVKGPLSQFQHIENDPNGQSSKSLKRLVRPERFELPTP